VIGGWVVAGVAGLLRLAAPAFASLDTGFSPEPTLPARFEIRQVSAPGLGHRPVCRNWPIKLCSVIASM
jgi:hypothetical protein